MIAYCQGVRLTRFAQQLALAGNVCPMSAAPVPAILEVRYEVAEDEATAFEGYLKLRLADAVPLPGTLTFPRWLLVL